jgi:hypothetical protein
MQRPSATAELPLLSLLLLHHWIVGRLALGLGAHPSF